jgi:hypothetical protein
MGMLSVCPVKFVMKVHLTLTYCCAPLVAHCTQEGVGSEVERSFGSTYETFAGYQGTINHALEKGEQQ